MQRINSRGPICRQTGNLGTVSYLSGFRVNQDLGLYFVSMGVTIHFEGQLLDESVTKS